ncbi:MAG: hypothetical protein A2885_09460 [Sphingopyxis sp. RIFCSPHIGHO2_01_FULL_65_24]|jgi:hypothetical protein|nr:MAG: hypothetical protein A2885_09460 [Sphingopyxis sp. RIFCSPHIGHO2_01_FULL_65_24]
MPGDFDTSDDWSTSPRTIGRDALRNQYSDWMKGRRYDGEIADERLFGRRLREMLPSVEDRRLGGRFDRSRAYVLPPLAECRSQFERWVRGSVEWE